MKKSKHQKQEWPLPKGWTVNHKRAISSAGGAPVSYRNMAVIGAVRKTKDADKQEVRLAGAAPKRDEAYAMLLREIHEWEALYGPERLSS